MIQQPTQTVQSLSVFDRVCFEYSIGLLHYGMNKSCDNDQAVIKIPRYQSMLIPVLRYKQSTPTWHSLRSFARSPTVDHWTRAYPPHTECIVRRSIVLHPTTGIYSAAVCLGDIAKRAIDHASTHSYRVLHLQHETAVEVIWFLLSRRLSVTHLPGTRSPLVISSCTTTVETKSNIKPSPDEDERLCLSYCSIHVRDVPSMYSGRYLPCSTGAI